MSLLERVLVFAENAEAIDELCAAGRLCAEKVDLVLIGSTEMAQRGLIQGADRVYLLGEANQNRMVEDFFPTLAALAKQEKPKAVIIKASARGRNMAARLAASFDTSVLNDALELRIEEGALISKKRVFGGIAFREEKAISETAIICISAGVFAPLEADGSRTGEVIEVDFISPTNQVKCLEIKAKVGEQVNLQIAKKVICVGRGIAAQGDLDLVRELADLIGAEMGCTRPIAEGEHWMGKERYVGVSGVMLKPNLYLGIGISGQIQHVAGIDQAGTIIAINNDKKAPIFKYADYGIVDDLYTVLPALIEKLKK